MQDLWNANEIGLNLNPRVLRACIFIFLEILRGRGNGEGADVFILVTRNGKGAEFIDYLERWELFKIVYI